MFVSMDLNASPLPEEDEEQLQVREGEICEKAVDTLRRERNERKNRLKREHQDEGTRRVKPKNDYPCQDRGARSYGRSRQPPHGWMDCPPFGRCIEDIVPSKVPLDEIYNELVIPGKRYSSHKVLEKIKKAGFDIGLAIDLTNTSRYYSPSEWIKQGVKHVKIACKGRDAVPDNESVNTFVHEVKQFVSRQRQSKKYVLVHCTHGHNRTGFMIIHYLMRTQLLHVTEAIKKFADARPPGIYKQDYINALYSFYHEVPENISCPPTPEWKRASLEFDLNGEAIVDDDGEAIVDNSGGGGSTVLQESIENKVITNDDVLGDAIPPEQQDSLRQYCFQVLPTGKENFRFPGSHPVSLDSENLQLLRQRYYYATWKADGTRYMMLIATHGCYLIDRNFCFRRVQMRFPLRNTTEGFHNLTLIDGEMIIDKIPGAGLKRRYLAYDLVALNSLSVIKLPFSERWKLLEDEIIQPRNLEKKQFECESKSGPTYKYDMELFGVRRKDFWLLSTVRKLLKEFIPKLSHAADGLIFQGWDDPYVPRTHEGLLKWKYPEMNSVDFLFEVGSENRQWLFLYERGRKRLMEGATVSFEGNTIPEEGGGGIHSLSGKIIECSWNSDKECWECMRIRVDKSTPNEINTYYKVMRSIKDNITEELLLDVIDEIITLPMYAERIAKAHRQQQQQHQHQHRRR